MDLTLIVHWGSSLLVWRWKMKYFSSNTVISAPGPGLSVTSEIERSAGSSGPLTTWGTVHCYLSRYCTLYTLYTLYTLSHTIIIMFTLLNRHTSMISNISQSLYFATCLSCTTSQNMKLQSRNNEMLYKIRVSSSVQCWWYVVWCLPESRYDYYGWPHQHCLTPHCCSTQHCSSSSGHLQHSALINQYQQHHVLMIRF